jgi:hypothetical protein
MNMLKSTYPKWHFGQIEKNGKKITWRVFLANFRNKKDYDFL